MIGLVSYFISIMVMMISGLNLDALADILAPLLAGIFSDDETWFYAGFLTLFIPSLILGIIIIPLGTIGYFPAIFTAVSMTIILPIFSVLAGLFGGLIGMIGRIVGEDLLNLVR